MSQDTRIALCMMGQLVVALCANDPDAFKQWLSEGIYELRELLKHDKADRLVNCHIGACL